RQCVVPGWGSVYERFRLRDGGQIGCDYQFTGGWVVDIRNMYDWSSNKRSGTIGVGPLGGARSTSIFNGSTL
ncbi:MAG: hypothetical protein WBG13_17975, partial [Pseudolabrys sp.]